MCYGNTGGPVVQLEIEETRKYKTPRWLQIAAVHGPLYNCEGRRYPMVFVRLDEPDILRWIYRKVFPDRLDEIEFYDDYYGYGISNTSISLNSKISGCIKS